MAVATRTATFTNATDAEFRAWAQAIHDILTNGGWVQTADTGQIDLATASAPVAVTTKVGYEIWRTNDAAGSIVNFYIKIYYGSGSSSATRPSVWITIGWGSDGSGNLTGTTSTEQQVTIGANPSGTPSMNLSAGDGRVVVSVSTTTTSLGMAFGIERTRDTGLNFKNEVLLVMRNATNTNFSSQVTNQTSAFGATVDGGGHITLMPNSSNTPVAGIGGLGYVVGMAPSPTSPSMNFLGAEQSSLGVAQDDVTVPLYGTNHTFRIQAAASNVQVFESSQTNTCILMRYE